MNFLKIFIYVWFVIAISGIIISAIMELFPPLKKNKYNKNLCLSCKYLERYNPREAYSKYQCMANRSYIAHSFSHPPKYCKYYAAKTQEED